MLIYQRIQVFKWLVGSKVEFQEFKMNKTPIIQVFGDSEISKITDYFEAKKGQCSYVFLTYPWTFWLHDMLLLRCWGKIATLQTLTRTSSLDLYWWKKTGTLSGICKYIYIYVALCLEIRRNYLFYELVNGPFSESTFVQLHFDCLFPNSSDPRVSISKRMITGCNKSSNS